jgi:hypothetical protein
LHLCGITARIHNPGPAGRTGRDYMRTVYCAASVRRQVDPGIWTSSQASGGLDTRG